MTASIVATATVTAVRTAIKPGMATERPAIPSLAVRALSTTAAVSTRGSFGTDTQWASWHVIRSDEKKRAQLNTISHPF